MSEVFGWAVCYPVGRGWPNEGAASLSTVGRTRADSIERFLAIGWLQAGETPRAGWKRAYREGWRAQHVRVTTLIFGGNDGQEA